uniref:Transposase n=1 Tax=Streptomyces sp. NBC_00003 TaxID=2903608 RepID=A0AAU2V6C0_9ACTN
MSKITAAPGTTPRRSVPGAVVFVKANGHRASWCPCPGDVRQPYTVAVHAQAVGHERPMTATPLGVWENYARHIARHRVRIERLEAVERNAPPAWRSQRKYLALKRVVEREERALLREVAEVSRAVSDDTGMACRTQAEELSYRTGMPVAACAALRRQPAPTGQRNNPAGSISSAALRQSIARARAAEAHRCAWVHACARPPEFVPPQRRALVRSVQTAAPPSPGLGAVRAA